MSNLYKDDEYPEIVTLRPAPSTRPVRTVDAIEEAGLVLDQAHSIAMYTSRATPNVGPQGPTGPTGPTGPQGEQGPAGADGVDGQDANVFDTIIASCSDELTPLSVDAVNPKTTFRAPYPFNTANGYVRISVTQAPVGSVLTVQLKMNDTTVCTLGIDSTSKTSVGGSNPGTLSVAGDSIPDDAEFTVFVTAVGSTFPGSGLKIALTAEKEEI